MGTMTDRRRNVVIGLKVLAAAALFVLHGTSAGASTHYCNQIVGGGPGCGNGNTCEGYTAVVGPGCALTCWITVNGEGVAQSPTSCGSPGEEG